MSRWRGKALILDLPGLVLIERGGGLVLGLVWIAPGSFLVYGVGHGECIKTSVRAQKGELRQ